MLNTLSICRTCPRDMPDTGKFGTALREALKEALSADAIEIMMVHCLGGCHRPGNLSFDAPDKVRIRLSDVTVQDTEWLLAAVREYARPGDRSPGIEIIPPSLQFKVTALSPKIAPRSK